MHDYIACVTKINDYLEEFPVVTVDRNTTKLLDLLDFVIPIKWQWQMQVQKFDPTAGTTQFPRLL